MNNLFPIYLKLDQLRILLVGAGPVGLEKLNAILANSPKANVEVVAETVIADFYQMAEGNGNIQINVRSFQETDLNQIDLVIVASNNEELNANIRQLASERNILLNIADKPSYCDFYLGSVVQKGNLKIGISTNGKSPTIAKRLKEFLNDLLPEEIDETLFLMEELRGNLKGDLQAKITKLNAHTADLLNKTHD